MKETPRTRKLNEKVKEAIALIISERIQDPRVDLVTVTAVEISPDLRQADVFVIAHGGEERYHRALEGLESARGRIRSLLGQSVAMKYTPELRFLLDRSVDEGERIDRLLREEADLPGATGTSGADDEPHARDEDA